MGKNSTLALASPYKKKKTRRHPSLWVQEELSATKRKTKLFPYIWPLNYELTHLFYIPNTVDGSRKEKDRKKRDAAWKKYAKDETESMTDKTEAKKDKTHCKGK